MGAAVLLMDGGVGTHALCLNAAAVVRVTCGNWRPLVWACYFFWVRVDLV